MCWPMNLSLHVFENCFSRGRQLQTMATASHNFDLLGLRFPLVTSLLSTTQSVSSLGRLPAPGLFSCYWFVLAYIRSKRPSRGRQVPHSGWPGSEPTVRVHVSHDSRGFTLIGACVELRPSWSIRKGLSNHQRVPSSDIHVHRTWSYIVATTGAGGVVIQTVFFPYSRSLLSLIISPGGLIRISFSSVQFLIYTASQWKIAILVGFLGKSAH